MSGRADDTRRGEDAAPAAEAGKGPGTRRGVFDTVKAYWRLVVTLSLLLAIAIMYQWKIIAVERVEEEKRIQKRLLTEQATRLVEGKNRALARIAAISLSWAIQGEMAAGNLGAIDRYFNYLVRQDRFKVILLVRPDGTVAVSTDKRMEGFPVDRFFHASVLRKDQPDVGPLPDGNLMAVAPVMGVAEKQGVLLLVYTPETVTLHAAGD